MKRKQITVIGLVVVLMGLLLSLDIKGLVKEENQETESGTEASSSTVSLSIEEVSESARQGLNASLAKQISDLEAALKSAGDQQKSEIQKQLAQKWDDVNQPAPAALYYEAVAQTDNTFSNWLKAGDLFTDAYQSTRDTILHPALVKKAAGAYQKATELEPNSLEAKTGLGTAYVNGASNPMQGIELLLEVVKADPDNLKANLSLGLFSMRSGQYDKAVDRFKTVIAQQPTPEAWFYLASSYEHLGKNTEAIQAYEKSKAIAADPGLTKFVDQKIQELSN